MQVERWLRPLVRFLHVESASGIVLLACTAVALALANSPWASAVSQFWHTRIAISVGAFELSKPLHLWIDDGLMTIFFFVVGLEIKRELVAGELRDPRKAALPVMAALGGMVAPAGIYLLLRAGQPGHTGWGIPMATDIAFVVGILAVLGRRVPVGLKILLLTLAIADDIGAILVIALVYSTSISLAALAWAGVGFALILLMRYLGVRQVLVYAVVGVAIWLAFVQSGIHPTVAGVLLGLLTPANTMITAPAPHEAGAGVHAPMQENGAGQVESRSPLERLETALHPWVAFGIMPLFALANAGVRIELSAITHPVGLAVAAGLVIGKPLGVVLVSWLAVRSGVASLPTGVDWKVMLGAGCLAGIGFTMSLFITSLALDEELLGAGKLGTLIGSAISAGLGCALLLMFLPRSAPATDNEPRRGSAARPAP